jgi:hypothetical protein
MAVAPYIHLQKTPTLRHLDRRHKLAQGLCPRGHNSSLPARHNTGAYSEEPDLRQRLILKNWDPNNATDFGVLRRPRHPLRALPCIAVQEVEGMAQNKSKAELGRPLGGGKRLRTYAEVAVERKISIDTVKRMVKRGELTAVRVSPKCVRIVEAAV